MAVGQGRHSAPLHVLVAVVTAAERGDPLPTHAALAEAIGCTKHNVTMAMTSLERRGVLRRIGENGRKRLLVVRTGAMTVETTDG